MVLKLLFASVFSLTAAMATAHATEIHIDCIGGEVISVDTQTNEGVLRGVRGPVNWSYDGAWLRVSRQGDASPTSVALVTGDLLRDGKRMDAACKTRNPEVVAQLPVSRGAETRRAYLKLKSNDKINVQAALKFIGIYQGVEDGLWGARTEEAVLSYYDGLAPAERDKLDITSPEGASELLHNLIMTISEGDECDGCELIAATEPAPLSEPVAEPVEPASQSGNASNEIEVLKAAHQFKVEEHLRDNKGRGAELSEACTPPHITLLGLCAAMDVLDSVVVLTDRGYSCEATISNSGYLLTKCTKGKASAFIGPSGIMMNCANFNICGVDIHTVARKLIDSSTVSGMMPVTNHGYSLFSGATVENMYCSNGDLGEKLCLKEDFLVYNDPHISDLSIELTLNNYKPGGGGITFN